MVILVSLCVWHAIAGSALYNLFPTASGGNSTNYYNTTAADVTTMFTVTIQTTTQATSKECNTSYLQRASTPFAQGVDKVAQYLFVATYVMLHVIFSVLILCEVMTHCCQGRNLRQAN